MDTSNITAHHIKGAKNKVILLGLTISTIIFLIIVYAYKTFYDPNQLDFISYNNHIFSYEINHKYTVNIYIPSGYELFDSKSEYNNFEYTLGRFKNRNIYARVGILSEKNILLAPGQDYLTDLWRKKFKASELTSISDDAPLWTEGHILSENDKLFATVDIYADYSVIKDGHMAIINILYEYNFFPISIFLVIHSDNQIHLDDCVTVYQDWHTSILKSISNTRNN